MYLCRAGILADAGCAGLGEDDFCDGIVPIRQERLKICCTIACGFDQGDIKARRHGHRALAAKRHGGLQRGALAALGLCLGAVRLVDGLGGGHTEAIKKRGPEPCAVTFEVDRPPERVPQASAVRAVVILRAPGHAPKFAGRHGAVLRLDNQFEQAVLGIAKARGFPHFDICQRDTPGITAPKALGNAIAV